MSTRDYLVIGAILFYVYWVNQSQVSATSLGAAGTPTGTYPVSTIALPGVATKAGGNQPSFDHQNATQPYLY